MFFSGLDYEKFRLFQLSVLWRASISTLPFFEKVKLGNHAETIRQLLLNSDPGESKKYGCLMFGIKFEGEAFTNVMMQPVKVRVDGHAGYKFVFGGFAWIFLVSSHDFRGHTVEVFLKPDGRGLFLIKEANEMLDLNSFAREHSRMGRTIWNSK